MGKRREKLPTGVRGYTTKSGAVTFQARWRDADDKQRTTTFDTVDEAVEFLRRQRTARRDPNGFSGPVTVGTYAAKWFTTRDVKRTTMARDRSLWANHVDSSLAETELHLLTVSDIKALRQRVATGHAVSTVIKVLSLARMMLDAAVLDGILTQNVAARVTSPTQGPVETRALEMDELYRFECSMDSWYRPIVPLMADTGLRIGEIAALKVSDIDFLHLTVLVDDTMVELSVKDSPTGQSWVQHTTKTSAGRRRVPTLTPETADKLRQMIQDRKLGDDDYLFVGPRGGRLRPNTFRSRQWARAVEKADLPGITPHTLRHTAISIWIATGKLTPAQIAKMAGHSSDHFVQARYGHLIHTDMSDVHEAIASLRKQRSSTASVLPMKTLNGT